jgi:hypothetical protein
MIEEDIINNAINQLKKIAGLVVRKMSQQKERVLL